MPIREWCPDLSRLNDCRVPDGHVLSYVDSPGVDDHVILYVAAVAYSGCAVVGADDCAPGRIMHSSPDLNVAYKHRILVNIGGGVDAGRLALE